MGLFKSIGKAFKKIVKGVVKVVKKVVKGVKKIVKKIGSSKILKALAIAAIIIVTGGAAIGAFGGSLATSTVGSWMVGASQAVTGGALFGTTATAGTFASALQTAGNVAAKVIFTPFATAGTAIGNTVGAVTDFTSITSKAGRMGYIETSTGSGVFAADQSQVMKAGELGGVKGQTLAEYKAASTGTFINPAGVQTAIPSGQFFNPATGLPQNMDAAQLTEAGFDPTKVTINAQGQVIDNVTNKVVSTTGSEYLTGNKWGDYALNTGVGVLSGVAQGYAKQALYGQDESGVMTPLANEGKEYHDALIEYTAENNINYGEIYGQLAFGTADPMYSMNADLYSQQTYPVGAV